MLTKLEWSTVKRHVNDLFPLEINPRKISSERQKKLQESLEKFNLAEIPIINFDGTILGGNQRCKVLQLIGRGAEIIDVRCPNRQLDDKEVKEYALTSNSHAGEWDFEILEMEFGDLNFQQFDIKLPSIDEFNDQEEEQKPKQVPVKEEPKRWFVYIDCVSERESEKMYTELSGRGFETKIVN